MTVIDAGVLVAALVDEGPQGEAARAALEQPCSAPEIVDLEVGAVLRRLVLTGRVTARRAGAAVHDLHDLPVERASHRPLLERCWALRGSVSFYDAAYVALAELLGVPLVTTDARLASAPGPRCAFVLVG